jgi:small GTP-binding protein
MSSSKQTSLSRAKVAIIGPGEVGKTTMMHSMLTGEYDPCYNPTSGANVHLLNLSTKEGRHVLECWDMSGRYGMSGPTAEYFDGISAVVAMYNHNNIYTFRQLIDEYIPTVRQVAPNVPIFICSNKADSRFKGMERTDAAQERAGWAAHSLVTDEDEARLARRTGCRIYRTSTEFRMGLHELWSAVLSSTTGKEQEILPNGLGRLNVDKPYGGSCWLNLSSNEDASWVLNCARNEMFTLLNTYMINEVDIDKVGGCARIRIADRRFTVKLDVVENMPDGSTVPFIFPTKDEDLPQPTTEEEIAAAEAAESRRLAEQVAKYRRYCNPSEEDVKQFACKRCQLMPWVAEPENPCSECGRDENEGNDEKKLQLIEEEKSAKNTLKIAVLGEATVGKTALVHMAATGQFEALYSPGSGAQVHVVSCNTGLVNDLHVLECWNMAGLRRFEGLGTAYYRGSRAALIVFSLEDYWTLEAVPERVSLLRSVCPDIPIVLCGNKSDSQCRTVSRETGQQAATAMGAEYIETSAKTKEGVEEAFRLLLRAVVPGAVACKGGVGYCMDSVCSEPLAGLRRGESDMQRLEMIVQDTIASLQAYVPNTVTAVRAGMEARKAMITIDKRKYAFEIRLYQLGKSKEVDASGKRKIAVVPIPPPSMVVRNSLTKDKAAEAVATTIAEEEE